MSEPYTPTTEELRSAFSLSDGDREKHPGLAWDKIITVEGLNRWLTAHDALVRADEREKCAVLAENATRIGHDEMEVAGFHQATTLIAAAIRSQTAEENNHG